MDEQIRKVFISSATYHYETSNYMGEDKVFVWLAQTFYNTGYADWVSERKIWQKSKKNQTGCRQNWSEIKLGTSLLIRRTTDA